MNKRKLVLEDGHVFEGDGFGSDKEGIAELVFNTAVVGYQEILSDPANYGRIVCMTYPVIGNYGLNDEDYESKSITVSGLVVREYNDLPSNFRYTHQLGEVMDECNVCGIASVDTRQIAKIIRDKGVMRALICDADKPIEECLKVIKEYDNANLVGNVSTKKVWHSRTTNPQYNIVALDLGIRRSTVKMLNQLGCNVVVVPYNASVETIMKLKPDGILISDGPGNPNLYTEVVELVKTLRKKLPILGIGLGCNILALAYNAEVYKDKAGHNGCNIPVKNVKDGKIEITTQNSLYFIAKESLANLELTHINVNDNTVAGILNKNDKVVGVCYNPVLSTEVTNVYNRFIGLIKESRGGKNAKKN